MGWLVPSLFHTIITRNEQRRDPLLFVFSPPRPWTKLRKCVGKDRFTQEEEDQARAKGCEWQFKYS